MWVRCFSQKMWLMIGSLFWFSASVWQTKSYLNIDIQPDAWDRRIKVSLSEWMAGSGTIYCVLHLDIVLAGEGNLGLWYCIIFNWITLNHISFMSISMECVAVLSIVGCYRETCVFKHIAWCVAALLRARYLLYIMTWVTVGFGWRPRRPLSVESSTGNWFRNWWASAAACSVKCDLICQCQVDQSSKTLLTRWLINDHATLLGCPSWHHIVVN